MIGDDIYLHAYGITPCSGEIETLRIAAREYPNLPTRIKAFTDPEGLTEQWTPLQEWFEMSDRARASHRDWERMSEIREKAERNLRFWQRVIIVENIVLAVAAFIWLLVRGR